MLLVAMLATKKTTNNTMYNAHELLLQSFKVLL